VDTFRLAVVSVGLIVGAFAAGVSVGIEKGTAEGMARGEQLAAEAQELSLEAIGIAERCLYPGVSLYEILSSLKANARPHPWFIERPTPSPAN
jgi:hypothetical protein